MIRLLSGLVDHFADAPRRMPPVRDAEVAMPAPGSAEAAALAVHYVSGMTDRFALGLGVDLLGWRPDDCLAVSDLRHGSRHRLRRVVAGASADGHPRRRRGAGS